MTFQSDILKPFVLLDRQAKIFNIQCTAFNWMYRLKRFCKSFHSLFIYILHHDLLFGELGMYNIHSVDGPLLKKHCQISPCGYISPISCTTLLSLYFQIFFQFPGILKEFRFRRIKDKILCHKLFSFVEKYTHTFQHMLEYFSNLT